MASPMKNMLHQGEDEEEVYAYAFQLAFSSIFPFTLKAAIELRLLDIIVEAGPGAALSPAEIAAQLPTRNPQAATTVDRILRLLAANGIVSCTDVGGAIDGPRYGAAPVCKYLTRKEDGEPSIGSLALLIQDKVFVDTWHQLKDSVLEGSEVMKATHGMNLFDYLSSDIRFSKVFNKGMSGHTTVPVGQLIITYHGFDDVKVLVDVGGNQGTTLDMITSMYPHIKAINFDLPHVISVAPHLPGVEHVSGDMFESIPTGDAIFIKWVLHDWADADCVRILKNCGKALPAGKGKVIVMEYVLPVVPEQSAKARGVFQLDLAVLAFCPGGKERTETEFKALGMEAGFTGFKAVHLLANNYVMEFTI
ncbi:hypothetical protein Cni_G27061 [Canna indica]|uniref:Uncharacterized protein n=1 Tax=Canna indica TaxID=4628 RepID=A0AAQ3QR23_9LILI|nr:hypothetical protein Cni_G27061 [Canna indica]